MRRLGQRLGVEAMSLYRYVPGKEDLLDAIVESLIAGMYADPEVSRGARATAGRTSCSAWPTACAGWPWRTCKAFPLVASRPPEAPWLRPPLRSLDWVETFLSGPGRGGVQRRCGRRGATARSPSFLLGSLLLEVASHGADIGPLDVVDDGESDDGALAGLPDRGPAARRAHRQDTAAAEFEESLEALLDRIAAMRVELAD